MSRRAYACHSQLLQQHHPCKVSLARTSRAQRLEHCCQRTCLRLGTVQLPRPWSLWLLLTGRDESSGSDRPLCCGLQCGKSASSSAPMMQQVFADQSSTAATAARKVCRQGPLLHSGATACHTTATPKRYMFNGPCLRSLDTKTGKLKHLHQQFSLSVTSRSLHNSQPPCVLLKQVLSTDPYLPHQCTPLGLRCCCSRLSMTNWPRQAGRAEKRIPVRIATRSQQIVHAPMLRAPVVRWRRRCSHKGGVEGGSQSGVRAPTVL
jgi:hypothetical protein